MTMELYFVYGLLAFVLTVAGVVAEHFIATRFFRKNSILRRIFRKVGKKYPHLCEDNDAFYCFFKRDAFQQHR
ncbi:hypothetical protein [Salidesulfovibrio onnuriiensis]|uniref:hypothetical protein n=1 Tax=Salidesulfovibrio onnuriiensis TaxID=2583823 RepID=UPI0011CBF5DE|nr:hypothetical protein [Salidesulfovibrio onnuriiensis]